ncbi:tectonin beta-propeller repeat-containing protein 2-like isoform X1 [Argiope bruennichi]|uniref:tectonin beta-propeller repeat-containing protein 2-like isoform X1 n=1 Tax=Argiope bruennichi TaxID=94029 RepID=UPI0024959939|nr:tectonin beta-propeller repeat-containing protein 2-like isoform X1 [Argiope bruennichi]XP_055944173.1 tectonin beta-propeller repeat-containing protein 2-like isoform X1 [Argiope bruennichi]XP_055944174.1 tectonin beta-propeller repeat-containing protein 2-like isoform X1 [Argiope bruennichi]
MSDPSSSSGGNYPVLQEYPLQSHLTQLIPAKAQKTLTTYDIEFTCIDTDGHYIAVGSNIGIVYLYDRIKNHLTRLRNENRDPITCVKILISLECLVVFGCKSGAVFVFKIPFDSEQELEKFTVEGLHSSPITSLEWVRNGIKFFSGDENGVVVCTEIDHFEHCSKSRILLNDQSKIVQLSYNRLHLVVSTLFRSLIFSCEDGRIIKIGQKERKCYGPFGALIFHSNNSKEDIIFASRPGQRLWKSDKTGVIHETMIFKSALIEPHPVIKLLDDEKENHNLKDFQFGKLLKFDEKYVLVLLDSAIVLIDPDLKSIVASSPLLEPIVDVSTCNNEIFILCGLRKVVRISSSPDPYPCEESCEEPSIIEDILIPLKGLSVFVKERSDSLADQTETALFGWLKKKRSSSSPDVVPDFTNQKDKDLPEVVKLPTEDLPSIVVDDPHPIPPELVPKIEIKISLDESDDIVYKPKKKQKKKVRFRDVSPKKKDREALVSDSKETNPVLNSKTVKNDEITKVSDAAVNSNPDVLPKSDEIDSSITKAVESTSQSVISENDIDRTDKESNSSSSETSPNSDVNISSSIDESLNTDSSADGNSQNDCIDSVDSCVDEIDCISPKDCKKGECESKIDDSNSEKVVDPDDIYSSYDVPVSSLEPKLNTQSSSDSQSTEDSLRTCPDDFEPPKYGVDWVEYKAPEVLTDLKISNDHIFCCDIKNQLYYSNYPILGLQWRRIDQPAEKIAVSPSESIFWVLYKGVIFAAKQNSNIKSKDVDWISVGRDVISIAVDEDSGWYVTVDGHLTLQPNLRSSQPFGYPEPVEFDHNPMFLQVATWNKVVWLLTVSGSLHSFEYKSKRSKHALKEIRLNGTPDIDSIFLGVHQTGWIIDSSGIIRFKIGVTSDNPGGKGSPWEVEASKYFVRNAANLPKAVLKALNNEALSSLIRGKQHICLSTSSSGVWFCKTLDNVLFSNQKSLIGHKWKSVVPPGTASATKWKLLSAVGIACGQGTIWCLNNTEELFCLFLSTNTMISVELPRVPGIKSLIPTAQSLWLLSEDGQIFFRRGITPNCLEGVWWQKMDLSQLGSERIVDVSCSFEVAWACTNEGHILVRLGSLCPSSDRKLPQAWIPLSFEAEDSVSPIMEKLSAIGKKFPLPLPIQPSSSEVFFCKVYVGPLGHPVWALDNRSNVYVREGVSVSMPIGKTWTLVPELQAKSLCISRNAVWLLKNSGKIFRRFGVTEKNPCGDYWKQIPGNMDYLSVTEDDDLWGLKDDGMYQHSSFVLNFASKKKAKEPPVRSISEEDWEDIMVDSSDNEL